MKNSNQSQTFPQKFCWTKFGAEAGESLENILARKELERIANDGVFLWGIGNSVAPGLRMLVQIEDTPRVVFSPMRSAAKAIDISPPSIVEWIRARGLGGQEWDIPSGSTVTSRGASSKAEAKRKHYALVCHSAVPLHHENHQRELDFGDLRNLSSGGPLGFSQVTSVVQTLENPTSTGTKYPVGFMAELVYPYFLELSDPVPVKPGNYARKTSRKIQREFEMTFT